MEKLGIILISVTGNVIAHYIIRWLDRYYKHDNQHNKRQEWLLLSFCLVMDITRYHAQYYYISFRFNFNMLLFYNFMHTLQMRSLDSLHTINRDKQPKPTVVYLLEMGRCFTYFIAKVLTLFYFKYSFLYFQLYNFY